MIHFDDVSKQFPFGNTALRNATFEIEPNEFIFFVGPSGAGKTTILKLITKELVPSSGSIFINDEEITKKNFSRLTLLRRLIGIVFQDFKILPDKNIFENVALGLEIAEVPANRIKSKVMQALCQVNLEDKNRLFPIQLSAGELQKVAIARAICGDRNIILADEPTGNLDPKTTWEIMRIFKQLEGKKTLIIATHNTDIVNSLRKRVIVIKQGKIIKDIRKGGYEL